MEQVVYEKIDFSIIIVLPSISDGNIVDKYWYVSIFLDINTYRYKKNSVEYRHRRDNVFRLTISYGLEHGGTN